MGPSLGEHLSGLKTRAEYRLSSEVYATLIGRVAATLQRLHNRGVVHLNVRPGALLSDPATNDLAITDFAVTKPWDTGDPGVRTGRAGHTDRYRAPEQRLGEVGPSVDQYALGVVAGELFSGPGAPGLTRPVRETLRRATAPRRADRFNSIAEFGEALQQAVRARRRGVWLTAPRACGLTGAPRSAPVWWRQWSGSRSLRLTSFAHLGYQC